MSASKVGLIKIESAIKTGWIVISALLTLWVRQKAAEIATIPSSHPSSVI